MFNFAKLSGAVRAFFKSFQVDHLHMAAEVRALGPGLFDRLTAEKTPGELLPTNSMSVFYDVAGSIDRKQVLESQELYRAADSSAYTARERAVLSYMATYINLVGQRVGTMTVVGPRGGASFAYSVIRKAHIEAYQGPRKGR